MIRISSFRRALAAAVVASTLGATASAQSPDPEADVENFLACRSIALLHLRAAEWRDAVVGEAFTNTLLDQMTFVMIESISSTPSASMTESKQRLLFTETYFLGQGRDLAASGYVDVRERDRALLDCAPQIWRAARFEIDELMKWRAQAIDAPSRDWSPPGVDAAARPE